MCILNGIGTFIDRRLLWYRHSNLPELGLVVVVKASITPASSHVYRWRDDTNHLAVRTKSMAGILPYLRIVL